MRTLSLLVVSVFILIALSDARAKNEKADAYLLLTPSTEEFSKTQRTEIAEDLLQKINAIDSYIPSLTPDESKWLDKENASVSSLTGEAETQKVIAITNSPQYQTREIKNQLKNTRLALECVTSKGVTLSREMFCCAYASRYLTDRDSFNDPIRILNKSGKVKFSPKVKKQLGLSDFGDEDVWFGYYLYGRGIQDHIVLPYMAKISSQ